MKMCLKISTYRSGNSQVSSRVVFIKLNRRSLWIRKGTPACFQLAEQFYFSYFCFQVSSFCQEALAIANSIIHPRSFPQVCSAAGPLSLSTSEHHPSNGPLSTDFDQSSSMSVTSRSLVQTGNGNSLCQPSILSRGSLIENSNGVGYSEIGQNFLRYSEEGQATGSSDVNSSLTSARNISEEYEHNTFQKSSVSQSETSSSQADHCIVMDNASQSARIQVSTSSSDNSMPQLLNQEGFIEVNKSKTVLENTTHETEQRDVTTSFFQSAVLHDTHNTFVSSEPKRRRADDSCIGSDQMLNDKQPESTPTSEEQWIGHTKDKECKEREAAATNEVSKIFVFFLMFLIINC